MDYLPGRVVEHDQGVVLVEHRQGQVFRLSLRRARFRPMHLHYLPRPRGVRRLYHMTIDPDLAFLDQTLNRSS
jgi:hypothetical protein